MTSGLDIGPPSSAVATALSFRVCATVAKPKAVLPPPRPAAACATATGATTTGATTTAATTASGAGSRIIAGERQEYIVGVVAERGREKSEIGIDAGERGAAEATGRCQDCILRRGRKGAARRHTHAAIRQCCSPPAASLLFVPSPLAVTWKIEFVAKLTLPVTVKVPTRPGIRHGAGKTADDASRAARDDTAAHVVHGKCTIGIDGNAVCAGGFDPAGVAVNLDFAG